MPPAQEPPEVGAVGPGQGAVGGGVLGGQAAGGERNESNVTPPQLQSLPAFDGKRGEGFVNWLENLETARVTYRWHDNALVQVATLRNLILTL